MASMTAEQFLVWLEQKDLVSATEMAELRRQFVGSNRQVSAKSVALLLQARGYLTASQARRLLQEANQMATGPATPAAEPPTPESGPLVRAAEPAPPRTPKAPPADDDTSKVEPDSLSPRTPKAPPPSDETAKVESGPAPEPAGTAEPLLPDKAAQETVTELLEEEADTTAWGHDLAGGKRGLLRVFGYRRAGADAATGGRRTSTWDSPLLLVGGGVLALLLLAGVTLLYLINRGGGDTLLKLAEAAYREGAYSQAIDKYNQFLERFPHHPDASLGVVHRGLAHLRQTMQDSNDGAQCLATARQVLDGIQEETSFPDVRGELATLLPDIAEGLARQAQASSDEAGTRTNLELADQALALVMNTDYVPKSLRPVRRVERIRQMLALVQRDLDRKRSLDTALAAIKSAVRSGDTRKAYAIRAELLKAYPTLAANTALGQAVVQITRAERSAVRLVRQVVAARTGDAVPPSVALATRRGPPAAKPGPVVLVTAAGAVYALDGTTGALRWRRPVGFADESVSVPLTGKQRNDVLLADVTRKELLCVARETGQLRWRCPVGERFARPCVTTSGILVATRSGKLWRVDPATGKSSQHAVLPQRIRIPPVSDDHQGTVYLVGEHASLFVFTAADLQCRQVHYLGHDPGAVRVAPVIVLDQVVVAENRGDAVAVLHVLAGGARAVKANPQQGQENRRSKSPAPTTPAVGALKQVQEIRLQGHVLTPPVVDGRLLAVATDRGQIKLFEVTVGGKDQPLALVADRAPTNKPPRLRYLRLYNGVLWVAGTELIGYQIQPQTGQLAPRAVDRTYHGDFFNGPLQSAGKLLVHIRRRPGRFASTVAATDTNNGKQVWQTDVGLRAAGAPWVIPAGKEKVAVITTRGALFVLDADQLHGGVADQPQYAASPPNPIPLLTDRIRLGPREAVCVPAGGDRHVLICRFDAHGKRALQQWTTLAAEPACTPSLFAGGLLTPTQRGQIPWLNPASGDPVADPFQPTLAQVSLPVWQAPCVVGENTKEFIAADSVGKLYRVGIQEKPARHLAALAETEALPARIVTPPAVLAGTVYVADAAGRLLPFALPDLKPGVPIDLGARPSWGPQRAGDHLVVATAAGQLLCVDGARKVAWRGALRHGPLAGAPLVAAGHYIFASNKGIIWRVDTATGKELGQLDVGQSLATGPVALGDQVIVISRDGAILAVKAP